MIEPGKEVLGQEQITRGSIEGLRPGDTAQAGELPIKIMNEAEEDAYIRVFGDDNWETLEYFYSDEEKSAKEIKGVHYMTFDEQDEYDKVFDEAVRHRNETEIEEVWTSHEADEIEKDKDGNNEEAGYVMNPEEEEAFKVTFGEGGEADPFYRYWEDQKGEIFYLSGPELEAYKEVFGPMELTDPSQIRFNDPLREERFARRRVGGGESGKPDRQEDFREKYVGSRRQEARVAKKLEPLPTVVPRKHENRGFRGGKTELVQVPVVKENWKWTDPKAESLRAKLRYEDRTRRGPGGKVEATLAEEKRDGGGKRELLGEAEEALIEDKYGQQIERAREAVAQLRKGQNLGGTTVFENGVRKSSEDGVSAGEAIRALPEKLEKVKAELEEVLYRIHELQMMIQDGIIDPAYGLTTHEQWDAEFHDYGDGYDPDLRKDGDEMDDYKPTAFQLERYPEKYDQNWWRREQEQQQHLRSKLPQKRRGW